MNRNEPVDSRVRLAITQWPPNAPRGAVTTFCAEHEISRKTFYEIRRRVEIDGPAAALEPRSRRSKSSPAAMAEEVKRQAIGVRAALERSGLEQGPGQNIYIIQEPDTVAFADAVGTIILEHPWPAPGTKYVSNGKPRGRRPKTLGPSPMS